MLPKHHGNVNLHTEHARPKNRVAQTRKVEFIEEREQRLQAQTTYQTPHITMMRAIESLVQANERLQAPHVATLKATESSIQT